jgi:hypothetical protein
MSPPGRTDAENNSLMVNKPFASERKTLNGNHHHYSYHHREHNNRTSFFFPHLSEYRIYRCSLSIY